MPSLGIAGMNIVHFGTNHSQCDIAKIYSKVLQNVAAAVKKLELQQVAP